MSSASGIHCGDAQVGKDLREQVLAGEPHRPGASSLRLPDDDEAAG
jgi:hypothetical protein